MNTHWTLLLYLASGAWLGWTFSEWQYGECSRRRMWFSLGLVIAANVINCVV